jgi:glucose-6-phosphate isomerase
VNTETFRTARKALERHHANNAPVDMRSAFAGDRTRFGAFSLTFDDLLLDWSKCAVDDETMTLLFKLAEAAGLEARRDAMFAGKHINLTEDRAVLHVALRGPEPGVADARAEVAGEVNAVLSAMAAFADQVRNGGYTGATGKPITDVVNIGIGGSDLGPQMAVLALAPFHDGPRSHFVSNVDGAHIHDTVKHLDPETTLFIIASKTFTTIETMTNAATARRWLKRQSVQKTRAGIFAPSHPLSTRRKNSASRKTASSASGIGLVGATRCGRPSVYRS